MKLYGSLGGTSADTTTGKLHVGSRPSLGQSLNRALKEAKQRFPDDWYDIFKKWEAQIRETYIR